MREMEEERANMREHVMKEVDTDKEIVESLFRTYFRETLILQNYMMTYSR